MKLQENVDTWERTAPVLVGAAVGAVALTAVARRRRRTIARDTRARPTRAIQLRESFTIRRPPREVFQLWRHPDNLSRFMRHITHVSDLGNGRSHWVMRGPAGKSFEWDAEVIRLVEEREIVWRSLPGSGLVTRGSVQFRPHRGDGTEVTVTLQYEPPGGKAAARLARLLGQSPESELREDLRRVKQSLEAHEIPTTIGQPAGRRPRAFSLARMVDA